VEILVAIVLVGVLTAIVTVGVSGLTSKGTSASCATTLDAARTGATSYLVTAGSAPASIQQMVGAQLLTLPPDAAVDATGTVASGPNWALVMRPGPSPTFSCDLVDRTYDATARSTPDLAGYLRVGDPTAVDLVAGVTLVWPAGVATTAGVTAGGTDQAVQFTASHTFLAGPYTAGDVNAWDIRTGSLTIAFWYRDTAPAGGTIVRKSDGANYNGWIIDQSVSGAIGCRIDTNGGPEAWAPPCPRPPTGATWPVWSIAPPPRSACTSTAYNGATGASRRWPAATSTPAADSPPTPTATSAASSTNSASGREH
jgi:hypothetical protein